MKSIDIRTIDVVQYLQPLREGGSLPAIVKADDEFLYVLKFRGAGQGTKVLVSELIGGEMARAVGLNVPELVFMNLDDSFSKTEPDEEIQDLLKFSVGLNLGLHFLSRAMAYDPLVPKVDPLTASKVVLLDSIMINIDRTVKNTNLLTWYNDLWLIDHGASFYFHHNWATWKDHLNRTFPFVKNHVLLKEATKLFDAVDAIKSDLTTEKVEDIVSKVPEDWLIHKSDPLSPPEMKAAYLEFINNRIDKIELLAKEAENAR